MNKVAILRAKVDRIVKMLCERNIEVTQRGADAFVQYDKRTHLPVRVNIPYLPDDASNELLFAIEGFVDHEVGHILFSDPKAIAEARRRGLQGTHNVFEDCFVERRMSERFPGSGHNIAQVGKFHFEKIALPNIKKAEAAGDTETMIGWLIPPLARAAAGQPMFVDVVKGYKEVLGPVYDIMMGLSDDLKNAATSWDALEVARKYRKALNDLKPKEPPPPPPEGPKEKSKDGKAGPSSEKDEEPPPSEDREPGEGEPKEPGDSGEPDETSETTEAGPEEEPKPKDEASPEGEPKDDEPKDPESEEGGSKDKGEPEDEGEPKDEGSPEEDGSESDTESEKDKARDGEDKSEGEDTESGIGTDGDKSDTEGGEEGRASDEMGEEGGDVAPGDSTSAPGEEDELDDGPELSKEEFESLMRAVDNVKDFDDELAKKIGEDALEALKDTKYRIWSTDFDKIEPFDAGELDEALMKELRDEVDHMIGPMQKDLERAVAARSLSVMTAGHRSGRLHNAALAKLTMFGDERAFRRKQVATTKDVAVELVVDLSGSMSGSGKVDLAIQAAYGLSSVLDRLKIAHEVIGFTTESNLSSLSPEFDIARKKMNGFARAQSLYMPIIKGFDDRITPQTINRFACVPGMVRLRENVDGECIRIAAQRLLCRRETRKVMMVLSDGQPACPNDFGPDVLSRDLRAATKEIEAAGVDLVGIGILTDAPKKFYKKHVLINNVKDLPSTVMSELKRLLMK